MTSVSFSKNDDFVLTAGADGTVSLWTFDGDLMRTVSHDSRVLTAAFSPEGNSILTVGGDGVARLWDLEGNLTFEIRGASAKVTWADFSPSGNQLATSMEDGTVRLWPTDPGDLMQIASTVATRDFTPEERARYADLLDD